MRESGVRCSLNCIGISITISMSHVTEGAESLPPSTPLSERETKEISKTKQHFGKTTQRHQRPLLVKIQEDSINCNKTPDKLGVPYALMSRGDTCSPGSQQKSHCAEYLFQQHRFYSSGNRG